MKVNMPQDFIMMPIPAQSYSAVCALLGGAIMFATGAQQAQPSVIQPDDNRYNPADMDEKLRYSPADAEIPQDANDGEIDAHGYPWSAELHASTKGKTKDGLWRMKVGVSRPGPSPGFPIDTSANSGATGTSSETEAASATSQTATDSASDQPATSGDDTDEFAAFRQAAEASNAADAAAAASVQARKFSEADLGALCNQAAVKMGDPSPIKEIIAQFTPEGQVAHSRNIPEDKREEFVAAVEAKAGIQFAG